METTKKRWVLLLFGFIMMLLAGLIYAWSIFITPLEGDFGWDRGQTSIIFTISLVGFCIGSMIAGMITERTSTVVTYIITAILFLAGFLLSSNINSLLGIYISYGVLVGLGVGFTYNTTISTVSKWFPGKSGLCSGILLMGFGLGGFFLGSIASWIIGWMGWRVTFMTFAVLFPVIILIGAAVIRPPKQKDMENLEGQAPKSAIAETGTAPMDMVKSSSFWLFFVWSLALTSAGLVIIGHAAVMIDEMSIQHVSSSFMVGILTTFNGIGRIVFGQTFDKKGLAKCMTAVSVVAIIASVVMLLAFNLNMLFVLIPAFILIGIFYGGVPTVNAAFTRAVFGNKHFAVNFSLVNMNLMVSSVLGSYLAGYLNTVTGSYMISMMIMVGYTILAFILFKTNKAIKEVS